MAEDMPAMPYVKWLVPFVLVLALAGPGPSQADEADAGAFLRSLVQEAFAKLNDPALAQAQKQRNFQALVRRAFDLQAIGRFVLGKYWARATQAQRRAFLAAFEELQMRRFLPLFSGYSEEQVSVTRVQRDPRNPSLYLVGSEIVRPDADDISLVWRIREREGQFKVFDIIADGVSMAISLRHEYGTVVQSRGIDGLIALIREKNRQLAAREAGGT